MTKVLNAGTYLGPRDILQIFKGKEDPGEKQKLRFWKAVLVKFET